MRYQFGILRANSNKSLKSIKKQRLTAQIPLAGSLLPTEVDK